jgi:hypothetical protein
VEQAQQLMPYDAEQSSANSASNLGNRGLEINETKQPPSASICEKAKADDAAANLPERCNHKGWSNRDYDYSHDTPAQTALTA